MRLIWPMAEPPAEYDILLPETLTARDPSSGSYSSPIVCAEPVIWIARLTL